MIPKSCKRLAEVDFPIAVVSRHAVSEKPIVRQHPQSFHQWWARRPLASCRAMLLALLLPDPCDAHCPADFKSAARELLKNIPVPLGPTDEDLRRALIKFIGDFADWDLSSNPVYLEAGRGLVKAAHGDEPPLVVDPFAGGGSIPLEALSLGCEAFASDLNPVACFILKVMLEDIPRHGSRLAEELRRVGAEIKKQAEEELAELYPKDPDGAVPIAYLWARTVRCEAPGCGAEIPLLRSFWLCKKANRKRALRPVIHHRGTENTEKNGRESGCPLCLRGEFPHVVFEIFEPQTEKEVPPGTVTRARATCLACGAVLPPERVRMQLAAQRGGADVIFNHRGTEGTEEDTEKNAKGSGASLPPWTRIGGARLLAVVIIRENEPGRHYRLPIERDYEAVWKAQKRLEAILDEWERGGRRGLCPVPDEPLPPIGTLGFRVQRYGMLRWGDLFTARQKVALSVFVHHAISSWPANNVLSDILALIVSRLVDRHASLVGWDVVGEKLGHVFNRQALPIVWDYAEGSLVADTTGGFASVLNQIEGAVLSVTGLSTRAQTQIADACESSLPHEVATLWFTDPPYYDAIPYADLSDFFFVWLKRVLPGHPLLRDPFDPSNPLTPKRREIVQDETKRDNGRWKDRTWFEEKMACAFAEGRRVLKEDGIGSVVFAHKTTEGWEALLWGLIKGGWTITASWPIATERSARLRARESAALATSVHLVCRPRPEDALVGDWADVLRELPGRVGDWMERLENEGVRGADLVFACIGPALEIFSRYSKVETPEGRVIELDEYLAKVWEIVGRTALERVLGTAEARARNGGAGVLEEDARLTALFLWTLQSTNGNGNNHRDAEDTEEDEEEEEIDEEEEETTSGRQNKGFSLVFDVVRRFAQPLGIDLPKWEGRVIETKKGVVRLLSIYERSRVLFGRSGAGTVAARIESAAAGVREGQGALFPDLEPPTARRSHNRRARRVSLDLSDATLDDISEGTTLDRVHAAMILQAGGETNALRTLLRAEKDRGPDFLRLANALSALYPKGSEEKRLLDAMLLAVPR